ncbi:MAG: HAMP domain-containing sensor histidine kinase, partial [Pseudomonadota bacterium]
MTTQLLNYERAQAEAETRQARPFDSVATARQVVDRLAPAVLRSGIDLSFEADAKSAEVSGDELLLSEAIDNLIDNACRHGGRDMTRIDVRVGRVGPFVQIIVRDDGEGIPA